MNIFIKLQGFTVNIGHFFFVSAYANMIGFKGFFALVGVLYQQVFSKKMLILPNGNLCLVPDDYFFSSAAYYYCMDKNKWNFITHYNQ